MTKKLFSKLPLMLFALIGVAQLGNAQTTVTFAKRNTVVNEAAGTANITINITNPAPFSFDINLRPVPQSTVGAADINFASQTINVPGNAITYVISIPIIDDGAVEDDEYLFFEILNVSGASFTGLNFHTLYIKDNDRQAPVATKEISLSHVGSFDPSATGSTTEVVAYDAATKRLFTTSAIQDRFDIIDFSNPAAPVTISSIDMSPYGGITGIAVKPGLLAVASPNANEQLPGKVVFFSTNGVYIADVTVGALPDMVTFSPDGMKVLSANEGQPNNDFSSDPEGSVSIIDVSGVTITQGNVTTLDFTSFNANEAALISAGVRKASTIGTLSQNLEPEYITISADGTTAWVTLQENNTIAKVNLSTNTITDLLPMGTKNNALAGNGFDASDTQTEILLANWPVKSFYIPDAIANYAVGGVTYLVTANEGDEREYGPVNERTTVGAGGTVLNPANFPHAAMLKEATNLGRFRITNLDGRNNLGQYDELYSVGSRSFSIWNAGTGALVYDSGNDIEQITAADPVFGALFNADNESNTKKNRSRAKGPEPEGIALGTILGQTYSFVALERIGGVMVYNVTNPNAPVFVDYINTRNPATFGGDNAPETLVFIPTDKSPDGNTYLVVANEISGTLTIFKVDLAPCTSGQVTLSATNVNTLWKNAGANDPNTFYYGVADAKRINAKVTGGVGPFTYQLSNDGGTNFLLARAYYPATSIDLFRPTTSTTITLTVTDLGASCQFSGSLFINQTDEYFCYVQNNTWYIRMCQNGQTVCVPWSTGRTLLQTNQATLGACNTAKATELVAARLFMQVQPNPANDVVTVFVGNASVETTISLMDANGRLLQTVTTNGTDGMAEQILNVSELPRGMYFVQAQNGGEIASDKLVIVR
jgi:hypothetical protein